MLKQLDAFFEASKMFVREQLGGERFPCETNRERLES
jgi:hypothetical protein